MSDTYLAVHGALCSITYNGVTYHAGDEVPDDAAKDSTLRGKLVRRERAGLTYTGRVERAAPEDSLRFDDTED